jgi:hypothetical protein
VQDLQVIDTIQSNIPGASFTHTAITPNSDDVIERAYFYTDKRDQQEPTRRWLRVLAGATNLADRSIVMMPRDLTPDVGDSFIVHNDAVSANHSTYIVDRKAVPSDPALLEPKVFSYDTRTLQRVAEFGFRDERTTGTDRPADLSNFLLLRGTDLAISALTNPNFDGGLRVWNVRTGRLVQSLPTHGVVYLAASPNQRRIVAFLRDEIQLFSINQAVAGKP